MSRVTYAFSIQETFYILFIFRDIVKTTLCALLTLTFTLFVFRFNNSTFVLAKKLEINAKNDQGETPLMVAVHQDQIDVVKLLHKAGKTNTKYFVHIKVKLEVVDKVVQCGS